MAVLKILSYSLIFIVVTASFIEENSTAVSNYSIHFVLHGNTNFFHGEYNVSIYIPHETQDIYLYTESLSINRITVTNNTQISKKNEEKDLVHRPKKLIYDTEKYITIIFFPYNLSSGNYILNIKYSGLFCEDGGFKKYINGQNDKLWATYYRNNGTRRLFPLWMYTSYASYNISIKHHKNYTALSNMPVQKVEMDENNMQWTRFNSTPVMPAYFIAASVVHLAFISETNQTIKLWCRTDIIPHVQFAYRVLVNITQFLENLFPHVRKSSETNHIVTPKLLEDVKDEKNVKFRFVFLREEDITFNQEKEDTGMHKIEIMRIIGYNVVNEWFCNKIDPYMWDSWLNKGFTTFFGMYIADEVFPLFRIQDFFDVQMQYDFLHWNTKDTWPLTIKSKVNTSVEIPRYFKASIMFRTLQILFTKKTFQNGMMKYLRNEYISFKLFWDVMKLVMNESSFNIKYNIDILYHWTHLNYYPVINVKRNYNNNSLNISIENFNMSLWIIMNITTQMYSDSRKSLPAVWLAPHNSYYTMNIDFIDKNDWVLVNLRQSEFTYDTTGYYRVNYDEENWNRLSIFLNSNSFEKIHALDRAAIIDDAFHFLMTGQLNSDVFLRIYHYLSLEKDYIVWYPMFKNLEYISSFFVFPESTYIKTEIVQPFNRIIWQLLSLFFSRDGMIKTSIFNKCLMLEAAKWLCTLNYYLCFIKANTELKLHLHYHKNFLPDRIWIGWKEWIFCNGLTIATNDTWMQVLDLYLKESDSSVLKFLTCSKNYLIIVQYIHLMSNMTTIDRINSFCFTVAKHSRNNGILRFILNDMEKIKPKEISLITTLTMIINHVYTEEQINMIKKYVEINSKSNLEFMINYEYHDENGDMVIKSMPFDGNMESLIIYVNNKIESRWHQIKTQLYEYRYLVKDFEGIPKAAWVNQFGEIN